LEGSGMKGIPISTANLRKCAIVTMLAFLSQALYAGAAADQEKLASANNGFAFQLLKQLAKDQPGTNIFISPYSVSAVLQMVGNGAGGQTKVELQQVLGTTGLPQDALNAANQDFAKAMNSGNTNVLLTTANAIWYRKEIPVKPEFIACNQQFFGATVEALDFKDPHSIDIMNTWASDKTHGRITHIADGMMQPASSLFLANAIYFKGKWEVPFEKQSTKDRVFHLLGGRQKHLPMMEQARHFTYRRGTGYQAVRLEYQGWDLAMYVFLPDAGSSPQKLLGILNGDKWHRVTKPGFAQLQGTVVLPRFKLEYGVELKQPLQALGLKSAFGVADFSGISSERLFISAVRQKTFVEVTEEGTEAAAVTEMAVPISASPEMNPPKPFEMIVDRPFLFLIEDQRTGTILFMGAMFEP
jgi:serine protease inhibitor